MDSRLYWIWMQQRLGAGWLYSHKLLRAFDDAKAVYYASAAELEAYKFPKHIVKNLQNKDMHESEHILRLSLENNGWILTPNDEYYSSWLRSIPALPVVVYGRGTMPNLDIVPAVTIVGTRESTEFGRRATKLISAGLAKGGMVVISGGARGIDAIAHEAAMRAGGMTIAVQGCGLDVNYPAQNEQLRKDICKNGAVISEFPPGTRPNGSNFPVRNRIMSGLSVGVCIMEAPKRSGALITARHALDQGRDVFAVAGDMLTRRSPGTDSLIQSGAMLINDAKDILSEYVGRFPEVLNVAADIPANVRQASPSHVPPKTKKKEPIKTENNVVCECPEHVSKNAKMVYTLLSDMPKNIGVVTGKSGLSASQVMTALLELELAGCVNNGPGQTYTLRYK